MKVFLQSIFAQILFTAYIALRGYQALPPRKSVRIPFVAAIAGEVSLYFFGYLFRNELPDQIMTTIQYICNTWYIASIYIVMMLVAFDMLRLTNKLFKIFPQWIHDHYTRVKRILFAVVCAVTTGLMIWGYHNVTNPVVRNVYITIPKQAKGIDSMTIAMVSDIHLGEVVNRKLFEKQVALINSLHPDMVVMVGDIIDYDMHYPKKEHMEEVFRQIVAPMGVYAVKGNHEYRANYIDKEKWLRSTGITLLTDSVAMPDSAFYLVGREDRVNVKRKSLNTLLTDVDKTLPVIVLDHQPEAWGEMLMNGIDLGLHGHTHDGQIWPYKYVIEAVHKHAYGYYREGNTQFYTSAGIGVAGPPYRIGTRSEVILLHIHFTSSL